MNSSKFVVAIAASLIAHSGLFAQAKNHSGYQLLWEDEFNEDSLDTTKWTASNTNSPTNNSRQDYLPSQVSVSNGKLIILSENVPSRGLPYRSGLVSSTAQSRFGRYEIRAKLPTSTGMWPAIWLLPNTTQHRWPRQGEIDIMENRGDEPLSTSSAFHWGTNPPFSHSFATANQSSYLDGPANYHTDFHTYSCEWDPDQVRFFVDGEHHWTVYNTMTKGFIAAQTAPMNLIINTAIGGDFLKNPNDTTVWPQTLEVEYVRVWEKTDSLQLNVDNGGFETNSGSLAGWKTFGKNSSPNVQAHRQYKKNGLSSCKLFGQSNGKVNYSGIEQGMSVTPGMKLTAKASAFTPANDSIAGTSNRVTLKIDYYSKPYQGFGTADYILSQETTLLDANSPSGSWIVRSITGVAPPRAKEARVAIAFVQDNNDSGAVFVDNVHLAEIKETGKAKNPTTLEDPSK